MIKNNLVTILIIARYVTFTMMFIGFQSEHFLIGGIGFLSSVILIFVPGITEVSFYTFVSVILIIAAIYSVSEQDSEHIIGQIVVAGLLIFVLSQYIYYRHLGNVYRVNDVNNYPIVKREMIVNELNEDYQQLRSKGGTKLPIQVYLGPRLICYVRDAKTNELKRVSLCDVGRINFDTNYPKDAQPYLELRKVHLIDTNYGKVLPAQIQKYEYVIRINKDYLVGHPRFYKEWQITDNVNEIEPII